MATATADIPDPHLADATEWPLGSGEWRHSHPHDHPGGHHPAINPSFIGPDGSHPHYHRRNWRGRDDHHQLQPPAAAEHLQQPA